MIKSFFRQIIVIILRSEARLILRRYRPKIVAITGSVGKTSAKEAVALALRAVTSVRSSPKSYNSEIGVPLAILGAPNAWRQPIGWIKNILHGLWLIMFRTAYPDWLRLEIGADRVGDIKSLGRWLHPDIAVLTSLPDVPAHIEFFPSLDALFKEKGLLLEAVKSNGTIIINEDDGQIQMLVDKLITRRKLEKRKIIRFGWDQSADVRAANEQLSQNGTGRPNGLTCKVDYAGHTIPLRLANLYGVHQLYAIMAAIATGVVAGMPLLAVTQALENYEPPPGRGKLLEGIKGTWILDDSYNASPAAMAAALETLKNFPATGHRVAVLGDMLELGAYAIEAHRETGKTAAKICDFLITVGVRAKFIADGAKENGFDPKKLLHFDEATEAGPALEQFLTPKDVVLVKGSQAMRLEKVVEEIMLRPELKTSLLARQEPEWQKR